ncbi:hypothetical protein ABF226_002328 [Flavobacterium psychrophilum]
MTNKELEKELKERGYDVTRIIYSPERKIDYLIVSVKEVPNSNWCNCD